MPVVIVLAVIGIRLVAWDFYRQLVSEDGILETLQFVFYFLTGCVLLKKLLGMLRGPNDWILKGVLLILGGGFLFLSGEEISWGERILNFARPDYFTVYNVQQEFSVHNLVYIQPLIHGTYILMGIVLGIVVPILSKLSIFKKFRSYLFGWDLSLYFLPLAFVYLMLVIYPPVSLYGFNAYGFIWRDQEVVETLLTMGLFAWAWKYRQV